MLRILYRGLCSTLSHGRIVVEYTLVFPVCLFVATHIGYTSCTLSSDKSRPSPYATHQALSTGHKGLMHYAHALPHKADTRHGRKNRGQKALPRVWGDAGLLKLGSKFPFLR